MATIGSMDYYKVWRARSFTSIMEVPQPYLPQVITGSPGTEGLLSQLRRWGINTRADLLAPEGTLTTELRQHSSLPLTLPAGLTTEPPLLRQGQFWYRTDCLNGITTVIEIMRVSPTQYQYRE